MLKTLLPAIKFTIRRWIDKFLGVEGRVKKISPAMDDMIEVMIAEEKYRREQAQKMLIHHKSDKPKKKKHYKK